MRFSFLVLATVGAVFLPAALVARFYGQQLRELKEAASVSFVFLFLIPRGSFKLFVATLENR